MIKIVKSANIIRLGEPFNITILPIVPASATYKETDETTASGILRTIEFSCRLKKRVDGLGCNLRLWINFDNGSTKIIGTEDLPVRLKVEDDSLVKISCKYKTIG